MPWLPTCTNIRSPSFRLIKKSLRWHNRIHQPRFEGFFWWDEPRRLLSIKTVKRLPQTLHNSIHSMGVGSSVHLKLQAICGFNRFFSFPIVHSQRISIWRQGTEEEAPKRSRTCWYKCYGGTRLGQMYQHHINRHFHSNQAGKSLSTSQARNDAQLQFRQPQPWLGSGKASMTALFNAQHGSERVRISFGALLSYLLKFAHMPYCWEPRHEFKKASNRFITEINQRSLHEGLYHCKL